MKKDELKNLPKEFKDTFLKTKRRIQTFGEVFYLAEFSFLTTQIIFSAGFDNKEKELKAESARKLIYEIFNERKFVDEKVQLITEKQDKYIGNLFRQGIILLWTSLESFMKDFVTELIKFDQAFLANESLSKIKIPMAEYFSLDDEQKSEFLSELIIDQIKGSRKTGINRYESILEPFDLNGPFDSDHKTNIYTLQQIRNCIVHNDSIADRRFCENCSYLGYEVGDEIVITKSDYQMYEKSVLSYLMEIYFRLNKNFGAPERYLTTVRQKLRNLFSNSEK